MAFLREPWPQILSFWVYFVQAILNKDHAVENIQLISTFFVAETEVVYLVRSPVTTQT